MKFAFKELKLIFKVHKDSMLVENITFWKSFMNTIFESQPYIVTYERYIHINYSGEENINNDSNNKTGYNA